MVGTLALSLVVASQAPPSLVGARSLALSPDGERIAFVYRGDVWVAPSRGGEAVAVTTNVEMEDDPVWSPDGQSLAFSSNRNGNQDVYTVSLKGGRPVRRTWFTGGDVPADWSADGKRMLLRSTRDDANNGIYELDLETGRFRSLVLDTFALGNPRYLPGDEIAYTRFGFPWFRPRYRGSAAAEMWTYDRKTRKRARLRENGFQHLWPAVLPNGNVLAVTVTKDSPSSSPVGKSVGRVTFDADQTPNVYEVDRRGGARPVTRYSDVGVRFLTVARTTGDLAYERDGSVFVSRGGGPAKEVAFNAPVDDKGPVEERRILTEGASGVAVSPDRKTVVIVAQDELWSVPVEKGTGPNKDDAVRLTDWEGSDDLPLFTPDGRAVFFVSDRSGAERLHRMTLEDRKVTQVTGDDADISFLQITPDGKRISFWKSGKDGGLYTADLAGGDVKRVFSRPGSGALDYAWSPDGKYIAYSEVLTGSGYYYWESARNIFIVDAATGQGRDVTQLSAQHSTPRWSPDGRYLLFDSDRQGGGLFLLPLQKEDLRGNEVTVKYEKPKTPVETKVDFDGIEDRIRRLAPRGVDGQMTVDASDGSVYYASGGDVWRVSLDGTDDRRLTSGGGIYGFDLVEPGKISTVKNGVPGFVELRKPGAPFTPVTFRADWTRDVDRERRAAFQQFWREYNRGFYDPNFHGRDWTALCERYLKYLPSIGHRNEMAIVLNEMTGELESSHSEVSPAPGNPGSQQSAHLGFTFDYGYEGPGIRVLDVPRRSPASYPGSRINPGDVVISINGKDVRPDEALYRDVLNEQAGREITLKVRDPKGVVRDVKYRALSGGEFGGIVFQNRLDDRRAMVERESGGKLTYVHIAGMSGPELDRFNQQVWQRTQGKRGLIIDVRNNGGGNTSDRILDILERLPNSIYRPRDEREFRGPGQALAMPIVVLCAQSSYSNAEMFPYAIRQRGLASLVGMPTPGYVIYTGGFRLVDGTNCRMPGTGVYRLDGRPLENDGVVPDVILENDPDAYLRGEDAQLKKAVEVLSRKAG